MGKFRPYEGHGRGKYIIGNISDLVNFKKKVYRNNVVAKNYPDLSFVLYIFHVGHYAFDADKRSPLVYSWGPGA